VPLLPPAPPLDELPPVEPPVALEFPPVPPRDPPLPPVARLPPLPLPPLPPWPPVSAGAQEVAMVRLKTIPARSRSEAFRMARTSYIRAPAPSLRGHFARIDGRIERNQPHIGHI
jgi:hypothetical protein